MVDVPDAVVAELAGPVAAAVPLIAARVPPVPAAELGRLRASIDGGAWPIQKSFGPRSAAAQVRAGRPGSPVRAGAGGPPVPAGAGAGGSPVPAGAGGFPVRAATGGFPVRAGAGGSPVLDALGSLSPLLVERLLGALELTVPELDLTGVPDLTGFLDAPFTGRFGMVSMGGQSEAVTGVVRLEQIRPGAVPLVATLARRLATHPRVSALLAVEPGITDEPGVAAAHGAAWLALAVATAAAVLHRVGVKPWATEPPTVLGVAIGTAALLLRDAPMPAGYAAAMLARIRAEYRLPQRSSGSAAVAGHRFALLEEAATGVPDADFGGNGLVAVVPGGAVIRTGVETGHVRVDLTVLDGPPPDVASHWEEIVEVSWRATAGGAAVVGADPRESRQRRITPPWPGDYRLRVHARGRDDVDEPDGESYELVVWQAPAGPETVYARTDRLGSRLRGEPQPVRPERPEAGYRWLHRSSLGMAATVTVVTGAAVADVLRAFGADPDRPESMRAIHSGRTRRQSIDPWVAVLDLGGAVLAVEYNGWQGSTEPVLTRASAGGRAASMFWNVNALTRLSFAEHGRVLLSEEPFGDLDAPPSVAPALAGLDFADLLRDRSQQGLVAVQRFTGHGIAAEDLARIEAADTGFRIAR